jgi:hypothetical protein
MFARTALVKLIARLDVPISMGESDAFEDYIKTAHNPKFSGVSRQTTTRDIEKYFSDSKAKFVETLTSSAVNCVCLTFEIWSGNAKEDYLSVVSHFINSDESRSGQNIVDRVASVLDDFGVSEKVFAVTLDNASSNASAMHHLRPLPSKYLGFDVLVVSSLSFDEGNEVHSMFLHQRCACHIINLIVKEALTDLKPLIETFRTAIYWMNSSK